MFRIKICGVTRPEDAIAASSAGADAIGLNFFSESSRFCDVNRASEIAASLPPAVARTGVFVNSSADAIERVVDRVRLDWVQLHGDEPPELIADIPKSILVLRGWRVRNGFAEAISRYFDACLRAGRRPDALLLDAFSPTEYGGTGKAFDWRAIHELEHVEFDAPIVLAGGLTPTNVADAIRATRRMISAVDVASGVELTPGIKDSAKIGHFIAAATDAFREIAAK